MELILAPSKVVFARDGNWCCESNCKSGWIWESIGDPQTRSIEGSNVPAVNMEATVQETRKDQKS